MKILQIIPFFAPAWGFGGSVRLSYDLCSELVKNGHEVTVLTTDAFDLEKRVEKLTENLDGILVLRFRNISNKLAKGSNIYTPIGFRKALALNVKKYDVVHLHAFFTYQNVVASNFCRKYKIPYVLHLTESPVPEKVLGKRLPKIIFNFLYGRKLIEGASKILVVSEAEKTNIIDNFPGTKNKVMAVPVPIAERQFKQTLSKDELRKKYGFSPLDKIIISMSRLSPVKRIDRIINILAKLDGSYKLIVAGPDEYNNLKKLKQLTKDLGLKDRIFFPGVVVGQEKDDYYSLSDLYALLSEYESASITTLEALQHDLPVCLSDSVGVAKEVLRFDCGVLLSKPDDAKKSAIEVDDLYKNRKRKATNCKKALKQFESFNFVDNVIDIYKEITKKEPKR